MGAEVLLLLAALAFGAEDAPRAWEPPSGVFSCELPEGWDAFEEPHAQGASSHILEPQGLGYRAGIDVHLHEPAQPGFVPAKIALETLRRKDKASDRSSTPVRVVRIGRLSFRVFEVTETRRLPSRRLPGATATLHHYVALLPSGESYFVIRLSSTQEAYLEHKRTFLEFLDRFRPR